MGAEFFVFSGLFQEWRSSSHARKTASSSGTTSPSRPRGLLSHLVALATTFRLLAGAAAVSLYTLPDVYWSVVEAVLILAQIRS